MDGLCLVNHGGNLRGRLASNGMYVPELKADGSQRLAQRSPIIANCTWKKINEKGEVEEFSYSDGQKAYIDAVIDDEKLKILEGRPEDAFLIAFIDQMSPNKLAYYGKIPTKPEYALEQAIYQAGWVKKQVENLERELGRTPSQHEMIEDNIRRGISAKHRPFYAFRYPEKMQWEGFGKKGLLNKLEELTKGQSDSPLEPRAA